MTRFRISLAAFVCSLLATLSAALAGNAPLVIDGKPLLVGGSAINAFVPATEAPVIQAADAQFVANGGAFSFTPTLTAGDSPVTYTASGLPGWASINSSTGEITGTASTGATTVKVTATNSAGADHHWVRIHAYSSTANISNTGAVQYLSTSGRKYTLTENITAPGCVLAAIATNIGVDLAGFTINSNGATPITVADGGFESVAGWSFASAANAAQFTGTYLNNNLFEGTKSLRFDCPTATSQYVESSATYELATSTVYSISYFCYVGDGSAGSNPGVTFYVSLVGTGGESTITASYNGGFQRGMQLVTYTFTSPSSGTPTYKIRVGITGGGSSSNDAYFDLVQLQRSHAVAVTVSPRDYAPTATPELNQYGDASGFTLANGTITQGSDAATESNGVFVYATDNVHIDGVTMTTTGKNSQCVQAIDQSSFDINLTNCTFTNNCPASGNRDGFVGSAVLDCSGVFDRCTITNAVHGGYDTYGNGTDTFMWRSSVVQNAHYTNAFALNPQISSAGQNIVAYNTIANNSGTESGRGIYLRGTVDCHHNDVTVRQEDNVQEYQGAPLAGAHAIQLETHEGGEIYSNTVTVVGSGGGQCVRTTYDGEEGPVPDQDLYWHDNTFTIDVDASPTDPSGERHPSVFKPVATDLSLEHYDDNDTTTNCSLVFFQEENTDTLTITGGTLRYIDDGIDNDYPFVSGYSGFTGTNRCEGAVLIQDVSLYDAGTATWLDQAVKDYYGWGDLSSSTATSIIVQNTATLTLTDSGVPIANTAVTVVDNQGNTVYNSTTNGSGVITFQAKDWDRINATRHDFNPHTITVSGHSPTTKDIDYSSKVSTVPIP